MVFYTLVLKFYFRNGQNKRTWWWDFSEEKTTDEKQNSATTLISVDGKGTVFPVKLKSQGESFE